MQKLQLSSDEKKEMSILILWLFDKIKMERKEFQNASTLIHEAQAKSTVKFRKVYEVHSLQCIMVECYKFGLINYLRVEYYK